MWGTSRSTRELFDQIESERVREAPAESAFDMNLSWTGKPHDPPARLQPGVYAWGEAHLLWAYALQYEATGDPRYLDTLVRRFDAMLALRDDRTGARDDLRNRVMPAWGSQMFSSGTRTCWLVHAGMICLPAAQFLRMTAHDAPLRRRFAGPFARIAAAIAQTIDAFEPDWREGPNPGEGYYVEPAMNEDHRLPTNQQNALGRVLVELSSAGLGEAYRRRAACLAEFLLRRMVSRPDGTADWAYRPPLLPPFDQSGSEDISHAGLNADFIALCAREGIVFTREDMERVADTFLRRIVRGDGRFADFIDGSGEKNSYADVIAQWGRLAPVRPEVASVIEAHARRREPAMGAPFSLVTLAMLGSLGR